MHTPMVTWSLTRELKSSSGKKTAFQQMVLAQLAVTMYKNANWSILISMCKILVYMDQGTPHKTRDMETYRGESGEEPGHGGNFWTEKQWACAVRSRINKWNLLKMPSFCKVKDTLSETKQQSTDWKKIFTKHIYIKMLDSRKSNNHISKCGTEVNKEFFSEEYRAEKH